MKQLKEKSTSVLKNILESLKDKEAKSSVEISKETQPLNENIEYFLALCEKAENKSIKEKIQSGIKKIKNKI